MTELVAAGAVQFTNGEPLCAYQECYRCFEGRNILFRLVNVEKKQWFFYNDTKDTIVHVRAVFLPGSTIRPLQRTVSRVIPGPDGVTDETCSIEVTLDIEPGFTESFIEGEHRGFNFEFRTETAPEKDVVFENRQPTVKYDKIYRCFKNNGNGLLFRLVDESTRRWFFYNDTSDFMMKVSVAFAHRGEVIPLGSTVADAPPADAAPDSIVYTLAIAPGCTEPFIEGSPVSYTLQFAAEPVKAPAAPSSEDPVSFLNGSPDPSVIPHQTHVFRCFKEHSNGLLFRIVDDVNTIWAFYNDTVDYVMTANMRYPVVGDVQFAPGVQVTADKEHEGGVFAVVEVLPLTTVPFLVGAPVQYELSFAATPVTAPTVASATPEGPNAVRNPPGAMGTAALPPPVPEEKPAYVHSGPDVTLMPQIDEVYRCFKEHGNGLLFRLVDKRQRRWAFYNDTSDVVASVRVEFPPTACIRPLGDTVLGSDPETGAVLHELRVNPLQTELFVEGDVDVFTTKFVAERIQT